MKCELANIDNEISKFEESNNLLTSKKRVEVLNNIIAVSKNYAQQRFGAIGVLGKL
jgi:hypothetical protein